VIRPPRLTLIVMLVFAALVVPDAAHRPATFGLVRLEEGKSVDFRDGVIWILAVGSDARGDVPVLSARADAIQLIGIDAATGSAVDLGVPRDTWVDLPGDTGFDRINEGLVHGGPEMMGQAVQDLVGIAPDYVFVTGFSGFRFLVWMIGGVSVHVARELDDPGFGLHLTRGSNDLDDKEALAFARSRKFKGGDDFQRSAHQQDLLLGILDKLRANEDRIGFLERGAWAAMQRLETDLPPTELYRLAQLLTMVRPDRVTRCVVPGRIGTAGAKSVVFADRAAARRLGADARDARIDDGCPH
jgi:LCP family protein required for cell wall assembly